MKLLLLLFTLLSGTIASTCNDSGTPVSSSGVSKATIQVPVNAINGLTIEQQNVKDRLLLDNKPGSIKHLYVISAYSGQVLIYSTVRGKVTSSGKRLTPMSVMGGQNVDGHDMNVIIDGHNYTTNEVIEDDGTYGNSNDYVFWWDTKGVYHQLYITGGMIVTISDQPLTVKNVVMNFEMDNNKQ